MPAWWLFGALGLYIALLFVTAYAGERLGPRLERRRGRYAVLFGLGLAVYCTSWTFYGAVGTAASAGWEFATIYLGPAIAFSLGLPLITRMVREGRAAHATSVADFLSARFGRSQTVASLVTVIAVVGALPYIALQLRSVAATVSALTGGTGSAVSGTAGLFLAAGGLAAFAVLFGARRIDQTRQNRGLITAIAFDSLVKLVALVLVGVAALAVVSGPSVDLSQIHSPLAQAPRLDRFLVLTGLSFLAVFCLPRQFHMSVVECLDQKAIAPGGLIFVAYLIVVAVLVLPITMAGLGLFDGTGMAPDLFVLAVPQALDVPLLSLLTFIGGFAAAGGMIIVAGVALSGMVTNDLILPLLVRGQAGRGGEPPDLSKILLPLRQSVMVLLLLAAALVAARTAPGQSLAALGTISFAAAAQFAPALFGGLYWRRAHHDGVVWGLVTGFAVWLVALALPALVPGSVLAGPGEALAASALEAGQDPFVIGVLMSLGLNTACFLALSLRSAHPVMPRPWRGQPMGLTVGALRAMLDRCLGVRDTERAFARFSRTQAHAYRMDDRVDGPLARFAEAELSRALGASSARTLMKSALTGVSVDLDDVVALLDETSQKLEFSQELLQATLETITQGVAVVDADQRLIAWNPAYLAMYDYPPGLIHVGRPMADLIRFNAQRGECGPGAVEEHVAKRLAHLKRRRPHEYERVRPDGRVVKIQGAPTVGGGYVTSFTDVTEYKRIEDALITSERSIRFYTDHVPAMIAFSDANEHIRFANLSYRRRFAPAGGAVVGRRIADFLTPTAYAERAPHIRRALGGETVTFDLALADDRYFQVSYVPQRSDDGQVTGFFGIYQDVTDRARAEQAVEEAKASLERRVAERTQALTETAQALDEARALAERATVSKTRFLAAASHDVLQPLNAARLFTSALKEDLKSGAGEALDLARQVEASLGSAERLLRSLLDISKLDAGGLTPTITAFPLADLLDDLASEFGVVARAKGLVLTSVPTQVWVRSDRGLLFSALQNLVSNAVRYTDEGRILIGCLRRGPQIAICVADTGRGIGEADQHKIFEEFQRLARDADRTGAGLGLAIVTRIMVLLDHDLGLASQLGHGSVFTITVPRATVPHGGSRPLGPARSRAATGPIFKGISILCVDNDPQVLDALKALLTRWGADPVLARTPDEAVAAAAARPPALVILDYQLDDGATGFTVLEALRQAGITAPAIMVTASQEDSVTAAAGAAGVPLLAKPVEPAALRALLTQTLRAVTAPP